MAQYAPKFFPGQSISLEADGDIDGGDCTVVSGSGTVATSSAESASFVGVAVASVKDGEPVALYTQGVHRLVASGGITAGNPVKTAAAGAVAAATSATTIDGEADTISLGDTAQEVIIGVALTTALDGAEVLVKLS